MAHPLARRKYHQARYQGAIATGFKAIARSIHAESAKPAV
jgi:hypothetical protein